VNNITKRYNLFKCFIAEAKKITSGYKIKDRCCRVLLAAHSSIQHNDYISRNNPEEVIGGADIQPFIDRSLAMLPGEEIIHVLPQESSKLMVSPKPRQ
jgi:cell division protein FtsA